MTANESDHKIKSVLKSFEILQVLEELDGAGVSEVAEQIECPTSTAYVYLSSLKEIGYVIKENGKYRVGYKFLEEGGYIRSKSKFYEVAKPQVHDLAQETGEVGNLGIEENGQRVLIYKSGGPDALHDNAPTGEYTNMHWTALGKAILAHLPDQRVEEIIENHGLPQANAHTITTCEELYDQLKQIREQGYSVEDQDRREGVLTVAAPVKNTETGVAVGSISVSGPRSRMKKEQVYEEIVDAVVESANVVELRYNHY